MVNFIVVTHGEFGAYLVEAAEAIVGRQTEGVQTVSISARVGVAEIRQRLQSAIARLRSPRGLLLLIDMPGGTPANLAFPLIKDLTDVEMVSGVNLYMMVSAFSHRRSMSLAELAAKVGEDAQKSIVDIRRMFLARSK